MKKKKKIFDYTSKHLPRYLAEFSFRFTDRYFKQPWFALLFNTQPLQIPIPQCLVKSAEE